MTAKQEIEAIVNKFFEGNAEKINAWWNTENPLLGDIKPADMVYIFNKGEKLLKIVRNWQAGEMA